MYRVTRGIQSTGCTVFFHDNYSTKDEVQRVVKNLRERKVKTIKVLEITEKDVTAEFLAEGGC